MSANTLAPPTGPRHPADHDFSKGLKWSFIFHFVLVLCFLIKSFVFPGKPVFIAPTLRVDIVGLPDLLKKDKGKLAKTLAEVEKKEAKQIETAAPSKKKSDAADPDEMVLKPKRESGQARQKKLKNALARIKALAKISESEGKQAGLVKGNIISRGSSLSGDAKEGDQNGYYDVLRERLQENWALPIWIARQKYTAQVQVFIDARGRLRNFRFVKLSGNAQFDDAVKRTLAESQPFPFPPPDLVSQFATDGILVGFPL